MGSRIAQGTDDIGRRAARCDADDRVKRRHLVLQQVFPSLGGIVLGILYGIAQGDVTTGDDTDNPSRRHAEGGRNLTGVQHTQAPAGARTHIEDATTLLHAFNNANDKALDLRYRQLHRIGYLMVLLVHIGQQLMHRLLFQVII